MTDRYAMRLCQWTGGLTASAWVDIADEAPAEAMARLALQTDATAYAVDLRDALTGEVTRIPKVPALPCTFAEAARCLCLAKERLRAEQRLPTPAVSRQWLDAAVPLLSTAIYAANHQAGIEAGLFNDIDFVRWAIHRAMPAAAALGHALDAPPRQPRKVFK